LNSTKFILHGIIFERCLFLCPQFRNSANVLISIYILLLLIYNLGYFYPINNWVIIWIKEWHYKWKILTSISIKCRNRIQMLVNENTILRDQNQFFHVLPNEIVTKISKFYKTDHSVEYWKIQERIILKSKYNHLFKCVKLLWIIPTFILTKLITLIGHMSCTLYHKVV
jgi:hypothetical protein